jgi:Rrf2 family protein
MKLSRQEEVAILTTCSIGAHRNDRVSLSEIAKEHGISLPFLKKIARSLRCAGIITSKEGSGGGYILSKDPLTISVLDILEATGTVDKEHSSLSERTVGPCPLQKNCMPQKIRIFISNAFARYCSNITIDQVIKNK